jgi:replicative DNA helicase
MLEYTLIGTALVKPELLVSSDVLPEYFENEQLRNIWIEIQNLISRNEHIDYLTVQQAMMSRGEDLTVYLARLMKEVIPCSTNSAMETLSAKMADRYRLNGARIACEQLLHDIDSHGQESIDKAIESLMSLSRESKKWSHTLQEGITRAVEMMESAIGCENGIVGVRTGLDELDQKLGGLHKSDLVVIAGRPAMGKTGLAMNLALNCDVPCGIISSEMSVEQLALRSMSLRSDIDMNKLRIAKHSEYEQSKLFACIQNDLLRKKMFINDKGGITIGEIQRQAREWSQKHGIKILFVDYIQKIKPNTAKSNKVEAVGEVAEGLKNIAKELNIPVVGLGQVNRGVEQREDKRPHMSDLKNSGDIEQEADVVLMIYRDDYYNPESTQKGVAELLIEKNRNGPCGRLKVGFKPETVSFTNLNHCVGF